MKRKIVLTIIASMLMGLLAGCPGGTTPKPEPPKPEYSTGYIPVAPEIYDAIPMAAPTFQGRLPDKYDLSQFFPTPRNQGAQGSCVGWATAYLKTYQEAVERKWSPDQHFFSPSYIYNQIYVGSCAAGSVIIDALNLLSNQGDVNISDFPYTDKSCSAQPNQATKKKAEEFQIRTWRKVNFLDDSEIKGHIADGYPVIFGTKLTSKFGRDAIYDDPNGNNRAGGHAMVVVGYDDSKDAYKVINSWGANWNDDGYVWITYRTFRAKVKRAYIALDQIKENTNNNPQIETLNTTPISGTAPLKVTYNWKVTDADGDPISCTIDIGANGHIDYEVKDCKINTSRHHNFDKPGTYKMLFAVSDGKGGKAAQYAQEVTVTTKVEKPTINTFRATPSSIESGNTSTLSWSVSGTEPITLNIDKIGQVTGVSKDVSPNTTTTYKLTATNSAGTAQKTVTVTVTNSPDPQNSKLSVNPNSITFTGQIAKTIANKTITLANLGKANSSYTVQNKPTWLTVNPSTGTIAGKSNATITLTAASCTTAGTETGTVTFKDNYSRAVLNLTRTCTSTPNQKGSLNIDVSPDATNWTLTGPNSYSTTGTGDKTLTDLSPGTYSLTGSLTGYQGHTVTVTVEANKTASVVLTLAANPNPISQLSLNPTSLSFTGEVGKAIAAKTTVLTNTGTATSSFLIQSKPSWITVNPNTGTLNQNANQTITITAANCTTQGTETGTVVFKDSDSTATLNLSRTCNQAAHTSGSLDTSFGNNGIVERDGEVGTDIMIDDSGRIVVVAYSSSSRQFGIIYRLNSDGSVDTGFNPSNLGLILTNGGVIQPDGKILIAGYDNTNGQPGLTRYNSDGSADSSFGINGKANNVINKYNNYLARSVALDSSGRAMIAGALINSGIDGSTLVARFNISGFYDPNFNQNGYVVGANTRAILNDIKIDQSGKPIVVGYENGDILVGRYNSNGSLDSSFSGDGWMTYDIGPNDYAYGLAIDNQGRSVVVGATNGGSEIGFILRLTSDGGVDHSFAGDGDVLLASFNVLRDVIIDSQNRIIVVGGVYDPNNYGGFIARYNEDGSIDTSFGNNGSVIINDLNTIKSVKFDNQGRIVTTGRNGFRDKSQTARFWP